MINNGDGQYDYNIALAYYRHFTDILSKKLALHQLEESLIKGYDLGIYAYVFLKNELSKLEASTSIALADTNTEEDSIDEDSDNEESDTCQDVESSSSISSGGSFSFKQQQSEKAAAWRQIVEQRKAAWQEKVRNASHKSAAIDFNILKKPSIAEHWDKLAVNGRLKLAELWDQRIINLVDAIKRRHSIRCS